MTWTPETNHIPFCQLTDDDKAALQACKHGWEYYVYSYGWKDAPVIKIWNGIVTYRAKPAPPMPYALLTDEQKEVIK